MSPRDKWTPEEEAEFEKRWPEPEPPEWKDETETPREESAEAFAQRLEREYAKEFRARKKEGRKPNGADKRYTDYGADEPFVSKKSNGQRHKHEHGEKEPVEVVAFNTIDPTIWAGKDKPIREFLDDRKLFPFPYACFLVGEGAVGKTLAALQASVAITSGTGWFGAPIRSGPVLFYSAEEPIREIWIRIADICETECIDMAALKDLKIVDLNTVADASIIAGDNKTGRVALTPLFARLEKTIEKVCPVAVFLDNRGLLITGNENDRNIAAMAMRQLQLLAEKYGCTIVMLAHPSLAGINSGTGSSGSTAWFNTGRSTVYMTKPQAAKSTGSLEDPGEPTVEDRDARVLVNNKANYGPEGSTVNIRWDMGRFICTDPPPRADDGIGRPDRARRIFMMLLREHNQMNMPVSGSDSSRNYAPTVFMREPKTRLEGLGRIDMINAMKSLIHDGAIKNENVGTKARPRWELVICNP